MSRFAAEFRALMDKEAEASLDRGETQARWLEALEEVRDLVEDEIVSVREAVHAETADAP